MEKEKIDSALQALSGISYKEWIKLSHIVNRAFEHKKNEQESQLKLDCTERIINNL
ncbi:MAG: hypothetical protein RR335_10600 [Eubacterium sp.]